jgi:hypothetical protein
MRARAHSPAMTMSMLLRAFMVLFSLILTSCVATVETLDGARYRISSEAFRVYAEQVFREQNRVASDLVFRMEDERLDAAELDRLEAAETRLLEDCSDLNVIAVRRRDGKRRRLLAAASAAKTVPDCERAVAVVARMLAAPTPR